MQITGWPWVIAFKRDTQSNARGSMKATFVMRRENSGYERANLDGLWKRGIAPGRNVAGLTIKKGGSSRFRGDENTLAASLHADHAILHNIIRERNMGEAIAHGTKAVDSSLKLRVFARGQAWATGRAVCPPPSLNPAYQPIRDLHDVHSSIVRAARSQATRRIPSLLPPPCGCQCAHSRVRGGQVKAGHQSCRAFTLLRFVLP